MPYKKPKETKDPKGPIVKLLKDGVQCPGLSPKTLAILYEDIDFIARRKSLEELRSQVSKMIEAFVDGEVRKLNPLYRPKAW